MLCFLFRKAALYAFFGGLLFPVTAAAVEVIPLSEPVDPQPAADLINTSPAAENFPLHNRLTAGPEQPSWNFTGLVRAVTWDKYGLRPPAFALTGNRASDPAAYPVLQTTTSSRRSSARRPRARAAAPAKTVAPKATAMPAQAPAASKTVIVSVPVPPPPPAAPKPATPEVYSAPAAPVAPPSPAIADAVSKPAPAPAIKAD